MEDILYNYGTSREEAEQLVKDFIKFSKGSRILNPLHKDITHWYRKPQKFIKFLKELNNTKSNTELAKLAKEGAELIHNDFLVSIYQIKTYEAAVYYGRQTKWCISMKEDSHYWEYYSVSNTIYFVINKMVDISSPAYKIAVLVDFNNDTEAWTADDTDHQVIDIPVLNEYDEYFKYIDPVKIGIVPLLTIENNTLESLNSFLVDYIEVPAGVVKIGSGALRGMLNLRDVKLPESVTSIGADAFKACTSLTSIIIPNSVTSIGYKAFMRCTSLTSITIPNSVTIIDENVFAYCDSLTSITIPNSATDIRYRAFEACKSLTSITIPESVTSIGFAAFEACTSLTIYAEATSKPTNWSDYWNPENRPVIWGYKQKSNNKKDKEVVNKDEGTVKENKMRNSRFKFESKNMSVFEIESKLIEFFNKKSVHVSVSKNDDHFDIYISKYIGDKKNELPKDIDKQLQKFVNNLKPLGDKEHELHVAPTKHGMHIYIATPDDSGHLLENFGKHNKGKTKCCICEKPIIGYGNDPYPVNIGINSRACDECNLEYVIPARLDLLRGPKVRKEATNKYEVEREASNIVLDDKYTWLFSVLADDGMDIEEGIEYMQDAIDILINKNGVYLVAFPYVDPNPEDISVDLVFADNPGPVIIYNREEATVAKDELHKPTNIKQPKTNNKEETN